MSKHDDFGTALPRLPMNTVPSRTSMTISPIRRPVVAPSIAVVARPAPTASLAASPIAIPPRNIPPMLTPAQRADLAFGFPIPPSIPRPQPTAAGLARVSDPVMTAITSPSGQEAAAKAADLVMTGGPAISPNTAIVGPMGKTPAALAAQAFGPAQPDTSGNGVGAPDDGASGGGAVDSGGGTDGGDPQSFDQGVSLGTPVRSLALVPGGPMPLATKAAAAIAPKESFWARLLALFGFGKKPDTTASVHGDHPEPNSTRGMVESVVRRARNGDQNAMALIALVRDNAKKGHGKAQETFALLQEYVRTHPVNNPRIVSMGYDPDYVALTQAPGTRWAGDPDYVALTQAPGTRWAGDATFHDAVALSHGPTLTNARIDEMLAQFSGEQQRAIRYGMANKDGAESRNHAIRIGKILGHARRLQAVRMKGSSLAKFDPRIGVELDE